MPSSPPSPGEPGQGDCPPGLEVREREGCRTTIQVLPSGVVRVTVPPGTPIPPLLERHAAWIGRKRGEVMDIAGDRAGQEGRILLEGRFFRLETAPSCGVREEEGVVCYTTPGELKAFLKERLIRDLLPRLEAQASRMRLRFTGLSVREQRSRWASCSPSGAVSVNLRVLALPGAVREYLVVHELAHLMEPNHSRRYWILLEQDSIWRVLRKIR